MKCAEFQTLQQSSLYSGLEWDCSSQDAENAPPVSPPNSDLSFNSFIDFGDPKIRINNAYLAAAKAGDLSAVRTLHSNYKFSEVYRDSALYKAAEGGFLTVIDELLVNYDYLPLSKRRAIRCLSENGHLSVIKELLKARTIETEDGHATCQLIQLKDLKEAIHHAAVRGDLPSLTALLEAGSMEQVDREDVLLDTIAVESSQQGNVPGVVRALLLNGPVSVNRLDTAIDWAGDNTTRMTEDRDLIIELLKQSL